MKRVKGSFALGGAVCLVMSLAACGAERTPERFCETMDQHKDRYLTAMADASDQAGQGTLSGTVGGISQAIAAMSDLNQMWEDLAEAAPDDIRTDVEGSSNLCGHLGECC